MTPVVWDDGDDDDDLPTPAQVKARMLTLVRVFGPRVVEAIVRENTGSLATRRAYVRRIAGDAVRGRRPRFPADRR